MSSFATQAGSGYSFPKLSIVEIVNCLSEAGFHVSREELKQPENYKDNIKVNSSIILNFYLYS